MEKEILANDFRGIILNGGALSFNLRSNHDVKFLNDNFLDLLPLYKQILIALLPDLKNLKKEGIRDDSFK